MSPVNSSGGFVPLPEEPVYAPSWAAHLQPDVTTHYAITSVARADDLPPTSKGLTRLDLFNTVGVSREAHYQTVASILGIKNTKVTLSRQVGTINRLYRNSIEFLEKSLYRHIPKGMREKTWSSVEEFVEAVHHHTGRSVNGAHSLMFCAILKVMIVEADIDGNPLVESLDADMGLLMKKFESISGIRVAKKRDAAAKKSRDPEEYELYELDEIYQMKAENRPKSANSIRIKEIYNRSYTSVSDFRDLLALRLELDTSDGQAGYVHMIRRLRDGLYGKSAKVTLEVIRGKIFSKESLARLRAANIDIVEKDPKSATDLRYEHAKFKGGEVVLTTPKGGKRKVFPEVQFVLPDNKNESGFSSHEVYSLKKILSANARLFGGLTMGNIKYILKKYPTRFDPRDLLGHLFYPPASGEPPFLLPLKEMSRSSGREKHYFTTSDIYFLEGKRKDGKKPSTIADAFTEHGSGYPELVDIENISKFVHDEIDGIFGSRASG